MLSDDRNGCQRIAEERKRQRETLVYTDEHDAQHTRGQIAIAAACYAAAASGRSLYARSEWVDGVTFQDPFPWEHDARPRQMGGSLKNPDDVEAIRLLEKAGALIAAEIDRLLRKKKREEEGNDKLGKGTRGKQPTG